MAPAPDAAIPVGPDPVPQPAEPAAPEAPEAPPVPVELVETTVGEIQVGVVAPRQRPSAVALCIHGKSTAHDVVWEWKELASQMCPRRVATVMPNLHSCAETAPASAEPEYVLAALQDILQWVVSRYEDTPVVVYGKSWGGALAAALASTEPASVSGLVLACPAHRVLPDLEEVLRGVAQPTLVLWARDDTVVPFDKSDLFLAPLREREAGDKLTVFMPVPEGGHRVSAFMDADALRDKILNWPDLAPLLRRFAPAASASEAGRTSEA